MARFPIKTRGFGEERSSKLTPGQLPATAVTTAAPSAVTSRNNQFALRDTISVKDYGAKGDGVTDDRAAIVSALAAAAGGTLVFPAGTYWVNLTGGTITVPDGTVLIGIGRSGTVIQAGPYSNAAIQAPLFTAAGTSRIELRDMTIQGPSVANLAVGQVVDGIKHNGTAPGATVLRNVYLSQFRYAIFMPGCTSGGTTVATCTLTAGLDADTVEIKGLGGVANFPSMGILMQAASGRCHVRNANIHDVGLTGDFHNHGVYVSRGYDTILEDSIIDNVSGTGRAVQIYDAITDLSTNGTTARYQRIIHTEFGAGVGGYGVLTSSWNTPTEILGCTFHNAVAAINIQGKCKIIGNTFNQPSGAIFGQVISDDSQNVESFPSAQYYTPHALIANNDFYGSPGTDIDILEHGATIAGFWEIYGNRFLGGTNTAHIQIETESTATTVLVKENVFNGTDAVDGVYSVLANTGKLVAVSDNEFIATAANQYGVATGTTTAPTTLHVKNNTFAQTNMSVNLRTAPTNFVATNNYGSKGYLTRAGGTASVADGGTISHAMPGAGAGTAVTPTKYAVTPTVANHIAVVTAVSATALTVALKVASTGAAVGVAENVVWWAEQ